MASVQVAPRPQIPMAAEDEDSPYTPSITLTSLPPSSPLLHASRLAAFPSLSLAPSPIGGRGLFAARPFSPGDVLLTEAAVCWGSPASPAALSSTLPPVALDATLLQMAPCCGDANAAPHSRALLVAATMKANAWGCTVLGGEPGARALFPVLCLCNHSCSSNAAAAQVGSSSSTPHYALTARKPIAAGEEITVSYVPRSWSKAKRRAGLREGWGFICDCERCAAGFDDTRALRCGAPGCDSGRAFVQDTVAAPALCTDCGAATGAEGAGGGQEEGGEEEEDGAVFAPLQVGAGPAELRAAVDALLSHPRLAPDDARVLCALNALVPAASQSAEAGEEGGDAVFSEVITAIVKVALRSGFVNTHDLGITIEGS